MTSLSYPSSLKTYYTQRNIHTFPTRRSSDLLGSQRHRQRHIQSRSALIGVVRVHDQRLGQLAGSTGELAQDQHAADRKSTRLNSSHVEISYAVFCLKKKVPDIVLCLIAPKVI